MTTALAPCGADNADDTLDTIIFDVKGTIVLTTGALTIEEPLNVLGPGPNKLKISGNGASRVFVVAGGTVTLAGVIISDGLANGNSPVIPSIARAIPGCSRSAIAPGGSSDCNGAAPKSKAGSPSSRTSL